MAFHWLKLGVHSFRIHKQNFEELSNCEVGLAVYLNHHESLTQEWIVKK